MTYQIYDILTGQPVSETEKYKIAKDGNLVVHDINQFAVCEDGQIMLLDDCGNSVYCDTQRLVPKRTDKYPDIAFLEAQITNKIIQEYPELREKPVIAEPHVQMFEQLWESTAGGFEKPGCIAGAAMTTEYTTVIEIRLLFGRDMQQYSFFGIAFGNKLAYIIENPNNIFYEDLKHQTLKSQYEATKTYKQIIDI